MPTSRRGPSSFGGIFDYDRKALRLNEVNAALENPSVWNEPKRAQELGREKKSLETVVETIDLLTTDRVLETIRITDRCLRVRGGERPRIGVSGLNPHAGEGGLFGTEELRVILPAVDAARAEGIDVSGPHPPDTVFMRARQGAFDVVVAMYHDQGLIPVKLLGLEHGVNTTLGLPFVRTSPDHGTAFDLAGTGRADPSSLVAAWDAALDMTAPP